MSFNDWLSSSTSRPPLSTATNFDGTKLDHHYYHHHHHYHYAPMVAAAVAHPQFTYGHQQHDLGHAYPLMPSTPVFDPPMQLRYKENLRQNSALKLRRCVSLFLHLIDETSISDFLYHDKHFRHADKYLLAMALIYFWRAKLREHHYTKDSFYLALWLAHDSVEEDLTAKYGLLPWALQTDDGRPSADLKSDFKRFLTKKNDLWTRLGFRARISKAECDEIMLIQANHWIWQRERPNDYSKTMAALNRRAKSSAVESEESSSSSTTSPVPKHSDTSVNHPGQTVPDNVSMDTTVNEANC